MELSSKALAIAVLLANGGLHFEIASQTPSRGRSHARLQARLACRDVDERTIMVKKLVFGVFLCWITLSSLAQDDDLPIAVFIDAGDTQALIQAVEASNNGTGPNLIFVRRPQNGNSTFVFDQPFGDTDAALPPITSDVQIFPINSDQPRVTFRGSGGDFRLANVSGDAEFGLGVFNVESFNVPGNGGVVSLTDDARFTARGGRFSGNFAGGEGGVVFATGMSRVSIRNVEFQDNGAGSLGGAISMVGQSSGSVRDNLFADNRAGVFGCDVNFSSSSELPLFLADNTFAANCDNVLIENPIGRLFVRGNTFAGRGNGIDSTATVELFANLFDLTPSSQNKAPQTKRSCNDFGFLAFDSAGYNISNDDTCALDQPTDMPNTDPMLGMPDGNGVIPLMPGSPAIDAGVGTLVADETLGPQLPCSNVDSRGLGRPQDADGDGTFECDLGGYEVQGGPALGVGQSGAFFDVNRSGEGVFLEMLSPELAFTAMFSYNPQGDGLAWFVGVDSVVGNSVVVDEFLRPQGTAWGAAFNPDEVSRVATGSMSLVFPSCQDVGEGEGRGVMAYSGDEDAGFEALLNRADRLTGILSCDGQALSPNSGLSGSFFDPARSGEGVFLQWFSNAQGEDVVLFIMYTFDPDGNQFWMISDAGRTTIDGNTITATMIFPSTPTGFGSDFDAGAIQFSDWGTITLSNIACSGLDFSANPTVAGFTPLQLQYSRLTTLAGTSQCTP